MLHRYVQLLESVQHANIPQIDAGESKIPKNDDVVVP